MALHSSIKLTMALLACTHMAAAFAQDESVWDDDPPGKLESAKILLAQTEKFKLKASQFHLNANESVKKAKVLKGQADNLRAGAADYNANLNAFKDHALQYRAHLNKVEMQLGHCQVNEAEYKTQLKNYSLHLERFHIIPDLPILPPPHICGALQLSENEARRMDGTMKDDQARLLRSEAELAAAENKLHGAIKNNARADAALLRRSKLAEEERKLAGEFAALTTEYELLKVQNDTLSGAGKAAVSSVKGKVNAGQTINKGLPGKTKPAQS